MGYYKYMFLNKKLFFRYMALVALATLAAATSLGHAHAAEVSSIEPLTREDGK